MKDMFGNPVKPSSRRGDHDFLSNYFDDDEETYKVLKVEDEYLERQIHAHGVVYAVYAEDKWKNAEEYRALKGLKPREVEVYDA